MSPGHATGNVADLSFDEAMSVALEAGDIAGVVAVAGTLGSLVYERAFGWRDPSTATPMTMDTVFMSASMTKAVTSVAAMQLVERGRVSLDEPLSRFVPDFAKPMVLDGFDERGAPRLRAASKPITLRRLLTHTSGYGHDIWSPDLMRYRKATGTPPMSSGTNASLRVPLLFDPGERWEYSIGLEWAGKVIEAVTGQTLGVYLRDNVTGPLGMRDTAFGIVPTHSGRVAAIHQRNPDGSLRRIEFTQTPGEYEAGGGGLYSTAGDYLTLFRMLLNGGRHEDQQILMAETVESMSRNQIGEAQVTTMKSCMPDSSNDFELFPQMLKKWGLYAMLTPDAGPNGRSAGSLTWGGIANCYFWIDPAKGIAGIFMTQIMPFGDAKALELSAAFEREIYRKRT
jgi:methyl acetate hydrolase